MTYPPDPNYPNYPPGGGYGSPYGSGPPPHVNNNLVWAILTTLFCCLPFGIVAIVKAAQVDGKLAAGDYAGAQASADSAKRWSIWSAVAAVGFLVLYLVFVVVVIALGGSTSSTY